MEWSFKEGVAIHTQIVEQIRSFIAKGIFEPGAKVPPVRELAIGAGVNPNTMQKALAELEREKLMHTERTSGRFVTEDRGVIKELRSTLCTDYLRDLFTNLGKLGMSKEEIVKEVNKMLEEEIK